MVTVWSPMENVLVPVMLWMSSSTKYTPPRSGLKMSHNG